MSVTVSVWRELKVLAEEEMSKLAFIRNDVLSKAICAVILGDPAKKREVENWLSNMEWDLREALAALLLDYGGQDVRSRALDIVRYYDKHGLTVRSDPLPFMVALYHLSFEREDWEVSAPLFNVLRRTYETLMMEFCERDRFILNMLLGAMERLLEEKTKRKKSSAKTSIVRPAQDPLCRIAQIVVLLDLRDAGVGLLSEEISLISKGIELEAAERLLKIYKKDITKEEKAVGYLIEDDYQFLSAVEHPIFSILGLYFINRFVHRWSREFRLINVKHLKKYCFFRFLYWLMNYIIMPMLYACIPTLIMIFWVPVVPTIISKIASWGISLGVPACGFIVDFAIGMFLNILRVYIKLINSILVKLPDKLLRKKIMEYSVEECHQ